MIDQRYAEWGGGGVLERYFEIFRTSIAKCRILTLCLWTISSYVESISKIEKLYPLVIFELHIPDLYSI